MDNLTLRGTIRLMSSGLLNLFARSVVLLFSCRLGFQVLQNEVQFLRQFLVFYLLIRMHEPGCDVCRQDAR